ncbi:type II toxin-antitoxin system HicA family toxin [Adhaeribacter pallidiroseus]|uniref:type II toxin-antitoxin system HicA family toxin n=1 Tax=Adhaeribacter pallidiroseus TaxID=2072847 RepID=UPI001F1A33F5|nr:type II toxin-antitoxin system HicA family toxin [Adhaeribacter pallidiroseus]
MTLFTSLGFEERTGAGSARKLVNTKTGKIFSLHEPHPSKILKGYVIKEAIAILTTL